MTKEYPFFHTVKEAAEILNLSESTIWRRIKDGAIQTVQMKEGGAVRIATAEIKRIEQGRDLPEVEADNESTK